MTELESPSCRFGVKLIQRADCLIRLALCRVSAEKLGVKLCLPYSLKLWMEKRKCFRSPHRSNLSFRHSLIAARFLPAVVEPSGDHHQICRAQRQEAPWSAGWMCGVSRHLHLLRVWVDNVLHLTCCRQRQQRDLQREVGWPTAQRGLSLTLTAVTALSHLSLQLKGHAQFLQCDVWCLQIRQNLRWGPTTAHSLPNSNHGRHMTVSESIGGRT